MRFSDLNQMEMLQVKSSQYIVLRADILWSY